MDTSLIGRCGLYCASCFIYAAGREPELALRRERFAQSRECRPEQVKCEGCGALTPACWGNDCPILLCQAEKAIDYCDDCPDYGICARFTELNAGYDGVPGRNLTRRREVGDAVWLEEQAAERACPSCRRAVIYGDEKCSYCGADNQRAGNRGQDAP